MKSNYIWCLLVFFMLSVFSVSCGHQYKYTAKVVKPRPAWFLYKPWKKKTAKKPRRTRVVKMKS